MFLRSFLRAGKTLGYSVLDAQTHVDGVAIEHENIGIRRNSSFMVIKC